MNTLVLDLDRKRAALHGRRAPKTTLVAAPGGGVVGPLAMGAFERTVTFNAAATPGKGGIHPRGADADGDGKVGEGKKKITDFSDKDGDGKPDAFSSSSSSDYETDSDDEEMTKQRSSASAGEDCGCGCGGEKKKGDCDGVVKSISKASKKMRKKEKHPDEGVIHRASDGKHDYYVYYRGRKISFGDASMPNKNHSDKHRANFNSRHNCAGMLRAHPSTLDTMLLTIPLPCLAHREEGQDEGGLLGLQSLAQGLQVQVKKRGARGARTAQETRQPFRPSQREGRRCTGRGGATVRFFVVDSSMGKRRVE